MQILSPRESNKKENANTRKGIFQSEEVYLMKNVEKYLGETNRDINFAIEDINPP